MLRTKLSALLLLILLKALPANSQEQELRELKVVSDSIISLINQIELDSTKQEIVRLMFDDCLFEIAREYSDNGYDMHAFTLKDIDANRLRLAYDQERDIWGLAIVANNREKKIKTTGDEIVGGYVRGMYLLSQEKSDLEMLIEPLKKAIELCKQREF